MKTIYKYELQILDEQQVIIPKGANILSVQVQDNKLYFYTLVDTDKEYTVETFLVLGTGNPIEYDIEKDYKHVGTVQQRSFVWHVFMKV